MGPPYMNYLSSAVLSESEAKIPPMAGKLLKLKLWTKVSEGLKIDKNTKSSFKILSADSALKWSDTLSSL